MDWISEDAKKIGSVNTVKIINKKCYGYNTDGDGFIMQLKSDGTTVKDSRIKIVGAGGSTMSIVYALVKEGAKNIIIYNRTIEKAKQIAENYSNVAALPLDEFSAMDCEILINTTSVGLFPDVDSSPVESLTGFQKYGCLLFDHGTVYEDGKEGRLQGIQRQQAFNISRVDCRRNLV